jgi:pilin isopeptide linkage protein
MVMKKKKWVGLTAGLVMLFSTVFGSIPVSAAGNAVIPVKQVFTIGTAANPSAVSGVYEYTLTADNTSFPMPSGSSGGVYTFTMDGNEELSVGPITTYTATGLYTYTLRETVGSAAGYTYDHTVYDVLVYVIDHSGTLQTETYIKKNGTKYDKAEFDPTYSEAAVTPTPTPTPTPAPGTSTPTPAPTPGTSTPTPTPGTPSTTPAPSGGGGASHPGPSAGPGSTVPTVRPADHGPGAAPAQPKAGGIRSFLRDGLGGVPTGDNSHIILWGSIFLSSLLLLGIDLFILWKNRKKDEEQAEEAEKQLH